MTPEARNALLTELEARLAAPRSAGSVQKIGGWYTVRLSNGLIKYPYLCPRCLRSNPERNIRFSTEIEKKTRLIGKTQKSVVVEVPHCAVCARALLTERRIARILSMLLTACAIILAFIFNIPGPLYLLMLLVLLWPVVALYSRTPTVKLGDCTESILEFRFKKTEYATAFATINGVIAQNADTIEEELSEAIRVIRNAQPL